MEERIRSKYTESFALGWTGRVIDSSAPQNVRLVRCWRGPSVCFTLWSRPAGILPSSLLWNLQTWTQLSFHICLLHPFPLTLGEQTRPLSLLDFQWDPCLPGSSGFKLAVQYVPPWLFTRWFILGDVAGWYPVSFCLCVYFSCAFNIFKGYIVFMVHQDKEGIGTSFSERSPVP